MRMLRPLPLVLTFPAMLLDAYTQPVALLGYPVGHSRSPLIHNTAFQAQGLNYVYLALPVAPSDLKAAVGGLRALHFRGANVTIPHKEAVLPLMDTLSSQAAAVGAVNTIVCRRAEQEGPVTLYGDNTDVAGFLAPLALLAASLQEVDMLVFGAGGAARAVVYALLTTFRPARLTIAARNQAQAERLATAFAAYDTRAALRTMPLKDAAAAARTSRLLVNATPLGMAPLEDYTPLQTPASTGQIVYDLVYTPTRLLREAASHGAIALGGLEMLIGQAAASYIQWTGHPMPTEVVRAALQAGLQR